jgi:subtilisin family serine protease
VASCQLAQDSHHASAQPPSAAGELEAGGNKVVKIFESDVFTGASIESTEDTLESLQANRVVNNVWNSKQIKLPKTFNLQSFSDDASAVEYNIHAMTGVDKLHEAGIYGKGVTVAVVDTGTYYTHEAVRIPGVTL